METRAADLFERYHVPAYRYFLRATGSPDIAQDLVQELFLKVLHKLKALKPGREGGWVFRVAHNLVLDYGRTHPATRLVALSDAEEPSVGPMQLLAFGLSEALNLLPKEERELFLLREVAGLSYAELAAICDTKVETVRSRLYQARGHLKTLLGPRLSADENKRRNGDG
jgi:RNA polymerase sigma-70 factor (ECF subfamily)